ncbi:MAG: addiction module protein [Planctomycetaceae bacterium]|nr:addiction module protein [Planctomycetaceae bacterium]
MAYNEAINSHGGHSLLFDPKAHHMATATDLKTQVLALSEPERAELASTLLRSLDDVSTPVDESGIELEQLLQSRIDDVESGQAELLELDEAKTELRRLREERLSGQSK